MRWTARAFDCAGLTWDSVLNRIGDVLKLRARAPDRFVILQQGYPLRFVQFFAADRDPGSVRAQAVSNRFLEGSDRLTTKTTTALVDQGWNRPTKKMPFFWRVYSRGTKPKELALLAVETMRDIFKIRKPDPLVVICALVGESASVGVDSLSAAAIHGPQLKPGERVTDLTNERVYRVLDRLGSGGFGTAYRIEELGEHVLPVELCLKVAVQPEGWHEEAYFGRLLRGVSGAIAVYGSFATFRKWRGGSRMPLYCLVTELAERGDLFNYLRSRDQPWTESRACREVSGILRVLVHLHNIGVVHRDLTPKNVLVTAAEHLRLADFGIARQRLSRQAVAADAFNWRFAPPSLAEGDARTWRAADDVYQVGTILAYLLGADPGKRPESADIKNLACSPAVKAIMQRAIGERRKRYQDAAAMLAGIEIRSSQERSRAAPVKSLAGKTVVFTGPLSRVSRADATALALRRGARVQAEITRQTDVVVRGSTARMWKADAKGQKLLDVERELERGHRISVMDERTFLRLVRNKDAVG